MQTADLLTIDEVAAALGIPGDRLVNRAKAGALPGAVWGAEGWAVPARSLAQIAEREGADLDITDPPLHLDPISGGDPIPDQLNRYVSDTLAAHAAVVLAKTQAAAARAEAQETGRRLHKASEEINRQRDLVALARERIESSRQHASSLTRQRDVALARVDELREQLAYEQERSRELQGQLSDMQAQQLDLIASLGPFGRRRLAR